jgi:hypothetical protein
MVTPIIRSSDAPDIETTTPIRYPTPIEIAKVMINFIPYLREHSGQGSDDTLMDKDAVKELLLLVVHRKWREHVHEIEVLPTFL